VDSVIVQLPSQRREVPASWSLAPGDRLTFGRGHGPAVDVPLAHPGVPRRAGEIAATGDHWLLTNLGRRVGAPIPFEFSRLLVPVADGTVDLLVFAPAHGYLAPDEPAEGERTVSSFSLDETAKYFLVLVALCEPRLRDPSATAVPSLGAVVDRLRGAVELTRAAVGFHVEYLAQRKLRLRERETGEAEGDEQRLEHRRQALAALALRFDLVRPEHLRLLPK
jgi:serine/threonine-protein kinase